MTQPNKLVEEWEIEFDKRVKALCLKDTEFGYKTERDMEGVYGGKEIFTVTDWGNVKSFIRSLLNTQHEQMVERVKGMKMIFNPDDMTGIFIDPTAVEGYNQAIEDVLLALNPKE